MPQKDLTAQLNAFIDKVMRPSPSRRLYVEQIDEFTYIDHRTDGKRMFWMSPQVRMLMDQGIRMADNPIRSMTTTIDPQQEGD